MIIVGSGAGGAAAAYRLARAGRAVLMLEKGRHLPRDGSTLDTRQVFKEGKFKNSEPWLDGQGGRLVPDEHYNVGGKTKWYGAALLRFSAHEFEADPDHQCLAWPFGLAELAPWYDEAERLLHVNRFANEPELQAPDRPGSCRDGSGWRAEALPLGLKPEILEDEQEAKHFDGYASVAGYKADAERNLIDAVGAAAELHADDQEEGHRAAARAGRARGDRGRGLPRRQLLPWPTRVVLAAGAMTSPRILQDHLAVDRPRRDAAVGRAGRRQLQAPPQQRAGRVLAVHPPRRAAQDRDLLQRRATRTPPCSAWAGSTARSSRPQLPGAVPKFVTNAIGARAIGFFVTTEDGSHPGQPDHLRRRRRRHPDRRLQPRAPAAGPGRAPGGDRRLHPPPAARRARRRRPLSRPRRQRARAGLDGHRRRPAGAAWSIPHGKVHGMEGLYVGDGSVLRALEPGQPGAHDLRLGPAPRRPPRAERE